MPRTHVRALIPGSLIAAIIAIAAPAPAPALADEATALIDSVYGPRIKEVAASRDTADDVELAREMLGIARSSNDGPAVVVELCSRVYQLASRSNDALDLAVDAMRLSVEQQPARRGEFLERAIAVQQRAYTAARAADRGPVALPLVDLLSAAGDDRREAADWAAAASYYRRALSIAAAVQAPGADAIRRSLNDVQNRPKLEAKADQLKDRLKAAPDDRAAAASLIDLYLVELDDPASARKYSFLLTDAEFARRIKLAAVPYEELADADLAAVGDLYRDLASKAPADARARMFVRSFGAYTEWLDRAKPDAPDRLRIDLAAADLAKQLASLGIDPRGLHRPSADNRIELAVKPLVTLTGHEGEWVGAASFSADGKFIAAPGADATVRVFDAATGRLLHTLSEHQIWANNARYVGDGATLISSGGDGQLILWATATYRARARISIGERAVHGFDVTPDGKRAVTTSPDGTVQIWNLGSSATPTRAPRFEGAAHGAAISPDGRIIAAAGEDLYILVADAATGAELGRLKGHWRTVHGLTFSPDGKLLASAGDDGTIRLWDPAKRLSLGLLGRHDFSHYRMAFSPDGRLLAATGADGRIYIYDVHFRTLAAVIDAQMEETYGVAFDAPGQRIVVGGKDKVARVFALERTYHKAAEPVTRDLPLAYFWCDMRRLFEVDEGVLWIRDDEMAVGQYFFAHADGVYQVRIKAYGRQVGDEAPKLDLKIDDAKKPAAATFEIKAAAPADAAEFTARVTLKRGGHTLFLHYTNDHYISEKADRDVAILSVHVIGTITPGAAAEPATEAPAAPDTAPPAPTPTDPPAESKPAPAPADPKPKAPASE